jgi:hypothetical protein
LPTNSTHTCTPSNQCTTPDHVTVRSPRAPAHAARASGRGLPQLRRQVTVRCESPGHRPSAKCQCDKDLRPHCQNSSFALTKHCVSSDERAALNIRSPVQGQ